MTPLKPYLIRAIYEWIVDNGFTPYLMVNAEYQGVVIPTDFVDNGRIILNIRREAVQNLQLADDAVQFDARFSGKAMHVYTPTAAVLAIYARESGRGMFFDPEEYPDETPPPPAPEPERKAPQKPQLRIVK